ncbi:MAG: restriction endonuclease subunit S [Pseudomonadota bacterium]
MKPTRHNDEANFKYSMDCLPNLNMRQTNSVTLPHNDCKLMRLKFLGRLKGGAGFPHDEQGLSNEEIPFFKVKDIGKADRLDWMTATDNSVSKATAKKLGAYVFPRETITFAKVGAALLLNRFRLLGQDSCIDNNMMGFMVNTAQAQHRFILYALSTLKFVEIVNPGAVPSLNEEQIGQLYLPILPLNKQMQIANYLDRETSQIDTLIKEKQHMLALLAEKRAALISRTVTRGLEPDVPLKPSGHPWLGDIPVHWKVKRSKQVLKERDERSVTGDEELLTVSHITGVTKRSEKEVYMFEAESTEGYKLCYPGNLVINTLWAWMGAMGIAWESGIVSPAYHVYELSSELLPGYVDALVRMPVFAKEVTRFSKGVWSSRLRLYPEGLYEVRLPVPLVEEQQQIIDAIANDRQQTAEMEAALNKSIALLKERRSALITAAVTGQLNVSGEAA